MMHDKLFFNSSKNIVENAKALRQRETEAEKILWKFLRNKNINGFKFRRQHHIKSYIVDFYCSEKMLSIELDGEIHLNKEQIEHDKFRTEILNELGITELRFANTEIIENITLVIDKIKLVLNKK